MGNSASTALTVNTIKTRLHASQVSLLPALPGQRTPNRSGLVTWDRFNQPDLAGVETFGKFRFKGWASEYN